MPEEISLVHLSAYVTKDQHAKIRQIAFSTGKTSGVVLQHLIAAGLLAHDAMSDPTLFDQSSERHMMLIEHRKQKIAELVAIVDAEFDARWEKLKSGLKAIRENNDAA